MEIKPLWRYWAHHESDCIFITGGDYEPSDPWVEEIDAVTYQKLKDKGYEEDE